jgi:hypothetical protein
VRLVNVLLTTTGCSDAQSHAASALLSLSQLTPNLQFFAPAQAALAQCSGSSVKCSIVCNAILGRFMAFVLARRAPAAE